MAPLRVSLPEELMAEILLRLPVRSVTRSKCVCKSWLFLISDPQFAKLHFDLAAAPTHRCLVKFGDDSKATSIDIDASFHSDSADVLFKLSCYVPYAFVKYRSVYVMGSCRGFLLLTSLSAACKLTYFIVWNPSTNIVKRFSKELNHRFVCGIVYDSSTDDYVLVIVQFSKHRGQQVHCVSLRTGSWSCTEGSTNVLILPSSRNWRGFGLEGSLLNGTLHWLLHNDDDNCS